MDTHVPSIDRSAPKRATSLMLNADLVAKAEALGLDLSERVERLLEREVEALLAGNRPTLAEIESTIEASNELVERFGSFADEFNGHLRA